MPEKKVRTVVHNGRRRSTGEAYSPKHNSRSGGIGDHVLANPERKNIYITLDFDGNPTMHEQVDFEKHEREFYEVFRPSLEAQNERYRKKGNKDRILTMDEYREARPPEETILQVGNKDSEILPEITKIAVAKWIDQMRAKYGSRYKIVDVAIHYDEPGTGGGICADGSQSKNLSGHAHVRAVWCAEGKDGWVVSESKALAQLGVTYDDSRARSRYNNPKITFTQESRELFNQLVEEQNIAIETTPARPGKRTMTKEEYITEQLREQQQVLQIEVTTLSNKRSEIQAEAALEARKHDELVEQVAALIKKKAGLEAALGRLKAFLLPIKKFLKRLAGIRISSSRTALDELLLDSECVPAYDVLRELEEPNPI